jgi:hypothetical protein
MSEPTKSTEPVQSVVMRLRSGDRVADERTRRELREAADMIDFFLHQLQMHSPKMNSQHSYRFRGGWPMTHAVGPSPEDGIRAAMAEVERSRTETA